MANCKNCGKYVEENVKFCPGCGTAIDHTPEQPKENDLSDKLAALNETPDTTADYEANDIATNKVNAVLAYFGPLVLIPILGAKDSKFARFHANQGLILLIVCIIWSVIYGVLSSVILSISWRLYSLIGIVGLVSWVFVILAILGIVNAATGKAKELPIIGKFKILK